MEWKTSIFIFLLFFSAIKSEYFHFPLLIPEQLPIHVERENEKNWGDFWHFSFEIAKKSKWSIFFLRMDVDEANICYVLLTGVLLGGEISIRNYGLLSRQIYFLLFREAKNKQYFGFSKPRKIKLWVPYLDLINCINNTYLSLLFYNVWT